MILDRFRVWAHDASASGRAQGVRFIADALMSGDLGENRAEAVQLLTEFLDDPSPLVRMAMADSLAHASQAPRHIITALADDQAEIAAPIIAHSPVLRDADLIDMVATGDNATQIAIAARTPLSAAVSAAVAEVGALSSAIVLLQNASAPVPPFALRRLIERHGHVGELRERILQRHDLPATVRLDLVAAVTRALGHFVTDRQWMSPERMARLALEQRDKAAIVVAGDHAADSKPARDLASFLRRSGQLTTSLALRALLSGNLTFFAAALGELTDLPNARVLGLLRHSASTGFAAVYRQSGLPVSLLPVFRAAVREARRLEQSSSDLSLAAVQTVLGRCEAFDSDEFGPIVALLRRFEAEAARHVARAASRPEMTLDGPASTYREQALAAIEVAFASDLAASAAEPDSLDAAPDATADAVEVLQPVAELPAVSLVVEHATTATIEQEPIAAETQLAEAEGMNMVASASEAIAVSGEPSGSLIPLRPQRRPALYQVDLDALEVELLAA